MKRGALLLALVVIACAVAAAIALFLPWHEVRRPDPKVAAGAFYFGPDYHVTAEDRARMLEPTIVRICRGVDHMRPVGWLFAALGTAVAVSLAALAAKKPWSLGLFAGLELASALFAFWSLLLGGLFVHLFERVGPSFWAEHVFEGASLGLELGLLASALLGIARAIVVARRRRLDERTRAHA